MILKKPKNKWIIWFILTNNECQLLCSIIQLISVLYGNGNTHLKYSYVMCKHQATFTLASNTPLKKFLILCELSD